MRQKCFFGKRWSMLEMLIIIIIIIIMYNIEILL